MYKIEIDDTAQDVKVEQAVVANFPNVPFYLKLAGQDDLWMDVKGQGKKVGTPLIVWNMYS